MLPVSITITHEPDGYHVAARFANDTIRHIRGLASWVGYLRAVRWTSVPRKCVR